MIDDCEPSGTNDYNPIEFISVPLDKEEIKKEALKVLFQESALLKAAAAARKIGDAAASLEPEMKAVAGSIAFVAKDVGALFADLLILASKALDARAQELSRTTGKKPERGT